uniref:Uncharacterized protein n=1 Tax=Anguilla anguilla TaxID=7936 RepID=A0A0E9WL53_ANGAN
MVILKKTVSKHAVPISNATYSKSILQKCKSQINVIMKTLYETKRMQSY